MSDPISLVAGVDEAGRGPLAGPVLAAAVILDHERLPVGLADSKQLSATRRERLERQIKASALAWSIGRATVVEIDQYNILRATLLAMQRAVSGLAVKPQHVRIDGNHCPALDCGTEAVIGGDKRIAAISAASILAKVARDREMQALDLCYPGYGFARHKGYPTKQHLQALHELGVSPVHRRTFGPVRAALAKSRDS